MSATVEARRRRDAERGGRALLLAGLAWAVTGCQDPPVPPSTPASGDAAGAPAVRLDGRFGDWEGAPVVRPRPEGFGPSDALAFGEVRAQSDARWLYLSFEVSRAVNIQAMEGSVEIALDGDGAPGTGGEHEGVAGVDALVSFSITDPPGGRGYGAGAAVQAVRAAGPGPLRSPYEIALGIAPTHAADRFELRVRRGSRLSGAPLLLGAGGRAGLLYRREGTVRAETGPLELSLGAAGSGAATDRAGRLPPPTAGAVRVVVWNVASESFRDRGAVFGRILAALRPDVVLLDEVFEGVEEGHLERVFRDVPTPEGDVWRFVVGRTGDAERSVVATHRPVRPEPDLLEVAYPEDVLRRLAPGEGGAPLPGVVEELDAGLSVAGAWVTVAGGEVLFVPVDFQSAGHLGSLQDRLRIEQARTLRARIDEIRASLAEVDAVANRPVVIGGDLNLVASTQPLALLTAGADVDGTALEAVDAYTLPGGSLATWRNRSAPFVPGRLDYLLVPDAAFETVEAFAFDTEHLAGDELRWLGLEAEDSRVSDHRPVVADLRRRGVGSPPTDADPTGR